MSTIHLPDRNRNRRGNHLKDTPTSLTGATFHAHGRTLYLPFSEEVVRVVDDRFIPTSARLRLLGNIGEFLALRLLPDIGFEEIRDLNEVRQNHADADLQGFRRYEHFISVKARNKWQRPGPPSLNKAYKLENNRTVEQAMEKASDRNAVMAIVAVQLDFTTYSAYFCTHERLCEILRNTDRPKSQRNIAAVGKGMKMKEIYTSQYETLASQESHDLPYELISNLL